MQEDRQHQPGLNLRNLKRRTFLSQMTMGTGLALTHWSCRPTPTPIKLRIGINDWIGFAIARYAQTSGIFEKRGLQVDFIEFVNLQDATRAMLRGALDASFSTIWDLMQSGIHSEQPVLLLVCDVSNGADGIVARSPLRSVKELQGKRVGVKLGTINELILLEALQLHAIAPETVTMVNVSNEIAANHLRKNLIDAAVLWQPLLGQTAQDIQGPIVYTTKDQESLILDVLATNTQTFQKKPEALKRLLWAWFDTMAILNQQPKMLFQSLAKELDQPSDSLIQDYSGVEPGTIALNRHIFGQDKQIDFILNKTHELLTKDGNSRQITHSSIIVPSDFILSALEKWRKIL